MKPEEIAALKALADAATAGPWQSCSSKGLYFVGSEYGPICSVGSYDERNTDFIAAAREAVPALIKHIEEQETIIARLSSIPR